MRHELPNHPGTVAHISGLNEDLCRDQYGMYGVVYDAPCGHHIKTAAVIDGPTVYEANRARLERETRLKILNQLDRTFSTKCIICGEPKP